MNQYSEDNLVEQPAIRLFAELEYETADCFQEKFGEDSTLGRSEANEVVLLPRLKEALKNLNSDLSAEALEQAIEELTQSRAHLSIVQANHEIYQLIKDGVKVTVQNKDGEEEIQTVRVIDFKNPENNDFFLASQFWVAGDVYRRRADLVGFVNGLPLIFVELKASQKNLKNAFQDNLRDYKTTVPQLFWYNACVILSNGIDSKVGSITSPWEHFYDWKRINEEGEKGIVSLETIIKGVCEKSRLLDVLENFTLFDDAEGALIKIIPRNHQFLGVNNTIKSFSKNQKVGGKIGVFWHTQGSGKSLSMVFFTQKVLRKFAGNYTFVVVTDRVELDKQIYTQFVSTGAVTEKQVQAESCDHLKNLLQEDHRLIFTLIQKFQTSDGKPYEKLTDRDDVIVITDEAHRSQYETLALNMRTALPKASFVGFTGTPLIAGEAEKTKEVFGDYVSVYNFRQSIADKATVPLFYENRIPELQLSNEDLGEDLEQIVEEAALDEAQEKKLEREFARQYHLITRDDRIDKVAADIVQHFFGRAVGGKAMVIAIDKMTAVKMYDKFQKHLAEYTEKIKAEISEAEFPERERLEKKLAEVELLDSAVVVSEAQNEEADFQEKGISIQQHRKRIKNEDLEKKFKAADDPLRLVFVCNMWLTGFDVPSLSTIYLDKPMRNHSLMQAIARANRVYGDKSSGLIVDYVGVFRNLQKALAIYAADRDDAGDMPIQAKEELVALLKESIAEASKFCAELGIDLTEIVKADELNKLRLIEDATNAILASEGKRKHFSTITNIVFKYFRSVLPDPVASEFLPLVTALKVIQARMQALLPKADIEAVEKDIEELLDESIETGSYEISTLTKIDLSTLDFEKLKEYFKQNRKNTAVEALKTKIDERLRKMTSINSARKSLFEKFQALIDEYNSGASTIETLFEKLLDLNEELNEEEKRHISENLSEEELALFDILQKPNLSELEKKKIKKAVKNLLSSLKWAKLVLDWKKTQRHRAGVEIAVKESLDESLPDSYEKEEYEKKCQSAYEHIYSNYEGAGRSIYEGAVG